MNEVMQASATNDSLLDGAGMGGDDHMALLQEMMGFQQQLSPDNPMTSQLLQLLAQQEEEENRRQAEGAALQLRLGEHYLTIAQNGTSERGS